MLIEDGVLKEVNETDMEMLENNPDLFWKDIKAISSFVFKFNGKMKHLIIPSTVERIDPNFMIDCFNLEKIEVYKGLKIAKNNFVENYPYLTSVSLGKDIERIEDLAFYNCNKINKVAFTENLNHIGYRAFYGCSALEKIYLPRRVTSLSKEVFKNCTGLKRVAFSMMLKNISEGAFSNCSSLEEVCFRSRVENVEENAFSNCSRLNKVVFKSIYVDIKRNAFSGCPLYYFVITPKKNYVLSKEEIVDMEGTYKCYDLRMFSSCFMDFGIEKLFNKSINYDELNRLAKKLQKIKASIPFDFAMEMLSKEDVKDINLKYYKQLYPYIKDNSADNCSIFCVLARTLGLFEMPSVETRVSKRGNVIINNVDYAQKTGEFLKVMLDNKILDISSMYYNFKTMNNDGFKRDYAIFMMDKGNFERLMKFNFDNKDFISKIYNHFEKVQLTNSNDRGSHKFLAPTVEKFVSYFNENKFKDIEDENVLSAELGKFYDDQELFEYAKSIKKEYNEKKISPNIVSVNLEEKSLLNIKKYRENIVKVSKKILKELADMANNNFTFEWLRKDDAINFTLGKYCNCCAHIADIGDGVVKASIIHPDVQNLILRDKQGTIVAKSTLYINREECYGVFNNVEICYTITEKEKKQIYEKYKMAIKTFAEVYNNENPNRQLKQINVGMHFNDLYDEIKYLDEIGTALKPIHYSHYSRERIYDGNSDEKQHIVWKKK